MIPQSRYKIIDEAELCSFLRNVCDLLVIQAEYIINQGYSNAQKIIRIDEDIIIELFYANETRKGMKVIRSQNLRALRICYRSYLLLTNLLAKCGKQLTSTP